MNLISVNIGQKQTLQRRGRIQETGIFKVPTAESVRVTRLGLENDFIVSKKHHGGPDQAIYVYAATDYAWWAKQLGKELAPGMFGENLTISESESARFNVGDYLHIDDVILQITAPRIPCSTFAARMQDPQWVKKFRHAERPGLYCRVIQEGSVKVGDSVSVEKYTGEPLTIIEMFRDYYDNNKSEETIRRHLNAPIAIRARKDIEKELRERFAQREVSS
jgi:MOSC domain-containing protein YiiM